MTIESHPHDHSMSGATPAPTAGDIIDLDLTTALRDARSQGIATQAVIPLDPDHEPYGLVMVPAGYHAERIDLSSFADEPRMKAGQCKLFDTASLLEYMARHAQSDRSTVYAAPEAFAAVAVFDDDSAAVPGWRRHRAVLQLKVTPAWLRWTSAHNRLLEQEAFAELIEAGRGEIASPPSAELLEMAQSFKATKGARFRSDKRLKSGRVQLSYVEDIEATAGADGQFSIPDSITLVLPPFWGASTVTLEARFRYRLEGSKLRLGVALVDHEEVARVAFDEEMAKVRATGVPVLAGTPPE